MSDYLEPEAPDPRDDNQPATDLVNAIWQSGWRNGHRKGWHDGHAAGRNAMNTWWAVVGILVSFGLGVSFGFNIENLYEPLWIMEIGQ